MIAPTDYTTPIQLYPNGALVIQNDLRRDLTTVFPAGIHQRFTIDDGKVVTLLQLPVIESQSLTLDPFEGFDKTEKLFPILPNGVLNPYLNVAYNFGDLFATTTLNKDLIQEFSEKHIQNLFDSARYEIFEDGMESDFSRKLLALVSQYGNEAVLKIINLVTSDRITPSVAGEVLRWLGHIHDAATYSKRLWLLEHCLSHANKVVRDGAIVGLGFLDDRHAVKYVRNAISNEKDPDLRQDLQQLLAQLDEPEKNYALSFKDDTKS